MGVIILGDASLIAEGHTVKSTGEILSIPVGPELIGRVVKVKGEIKAYTFGFEINDDMFCVYLETADLKIKGLPEGKNLFSSR